MNASPSAAAITRSRSWLACWYISAARVKGGGALVATSPNSSQGARAAAIRRSTANVTATIMTGVSTVVMAGAPIVADSGPPEHCSPACRRRAPKASGG
ncbi:hypothetical protein ACQP1W_42785 [Spirillospora sp. CA-255316]